MASTPTIIEISHNDSREYRYLKLSNRLEVCLVHDITTEKSAACMDINIGENHYIWHY